jgi:AcrR family transcriptional regulator
LCGGALLTRLTGRFMSTSSRIVRRHAPAVERRAQIVEAALGCFSARGYHATTMDDLVAASGLSKGSLYWHFESKEEVFLALFDHLAEEIFGRFEQAAAAGQSDVVALLQRELEIFLARFGSERRLLLAWAEFLSHPRGRERMAGIYRVSRQKLAALIRLGIERGELRALPPESVAAALNGTVEALVLQSLVDPDFDPGEHVATLWEILRRGLAPEADAPRPEEMRCAGT